MIIGVCGKMGSGKKMVTDYLLLKGFKRYLSNLDFKESDNFVIENIKSVEEIESLRKKGEFILFYLESDIETRYSRITERRFHGDNISFEDFILKEKNNSDFDSIKSFMDSRDFIFNNDWTKEDLFKKIDRALFQIKNKKVGISKTGFSCGILNDAMIKKRVLEGAIEIIPFDEKCVQPASYDLHLDNQFKVFRPYRTEIIDTKNPVSDLMEDVDLMERNSFVLHPGSFALALVKEITGVDNKHVGRLEGKSSLGRLGLIIHTTAGLLDPGNSLRLTLHLYNVSPLPIKLYPGMKIAQIVFEEMLEECEVPYGKERGSSYYKVQDIQESKMYKNFEDFDEKTGMYNPKV